MHTRNGGMLGNCDFNDVLPVVSAMSTMSHGLANVRNAILFQNAVQAVHFQDSKRMGGVVGGSISNI